MTEDLRPPGRGPKAAPGPSSRAMSATSVAAAARVLLVERRDTVAPRDPNAPKVRRYRLARLQLNGRAGGRGRYEHLRRSYD
jgi:hypothetical protein